MKYKFCNIRISATKYEITFATKDGVNPQPRGYALRTGEDCTI